MNQNIDYRIKKPDAKDFNDNGRLAWDVIEALWDVVPLSKKGLEILQQVTRGQRALLALDWCQKEIRNGGFEQFFLNSTGVFANEALKGFRLIGADVYAKLLEKAMSIFSGSETPISRSKRSRIIGSISKEKRDRFFDPLETRFYELVNSSEHDLEKYRAGYVRSHLDEFFIN